MHSMRSSTRRRRKPGNLERPVTRHLKLALGILAFGATPAMAQDVASTSMIQRVELTGMPDTLGVNDTVRVAAVARGDGNGQVTVPFVYYTSNRRALGIDSAGRLVGYRPGTYTVYAMARPSDLEQQQMTDALQARLFDSATVRVGWPEVERITLAGPARIYAGTSVPLTASIVDVAGLDRRDALRWSSSDRRVAEVSGGVLTAISPGTSTVTAETGGVTGTVQITVAANRARSLTLTPSRDSARTGDVIHFTAAALDADGRAVPDYPVTFAVMAQVEDTVIAPGAPAQVDQSGRFVAERAGRYTVLAAGGNLVARSTVPIGHRFSTIRIGTQTDSAGSIRGATASGGLPGTTRIAQGRVNEVHTSDIWVWEGKDGRDYAVTGTWGGDGVTYFWDVTDPANPVKTDSVQVDARTVNDVKADGESGICVITREGASNRRNGLVVLDCSDPRNVEVLSTFDDGLFGGVHNVYLWKNHVFAINAGRRFDIISIEDPKTPRRVSFFELDTPGHGIHDVWVVDGIAYASQWGDGVILVDVGNGVAGGSLAAPKYVSSYKYPIGAAHSAYPYRSKTGKFYVFVGDEQFPYGLDPSRPAEAGGYIHIVDFSDVKQPVEVARYQIPEAGPHNFWIQNDSLYVAYYNAGLRVVDVSGELMGNLYNQGRELVRFGASDPIGIVANTPMAWGPQPHKGHVFFSDFNSGLWTVKLPERAARELTP